MQRSIYYALINRDTWFELGTLQDKLRTIGIPDADQPGLIEFKETAQTCPHNLPPQLTSFIGREKEMAEVKSLLSKSRMLTLTGAGGCGKSRLTLEVAAALSDGFPDGVWLVELAPLSGPDLVTQNVAGVLGLREEEGKPIDQTLQEHLEAQHLLLLLDNCEHVLDGCVRLLKALLKPCPHITVLANSRERLGITGEQIYKVPSLALPPEHGPITLQSLLEYEAVRLFVDRARAVKPQFELTQADVEPLVKVCVRLDGIPFALELAAARVRSLSVEEINTRLDNRFLLLTGGCRTALPRHKTLRALIDWSYDLLDSQEKALLYRLSVFAGEWRLEAAEQVCIGEGIERWEVFNLLTSLVDKSLVMCEDRERKTHYRLLETIRQYGQERLIASGERDAVRGRHRDYLLALLALAEKHCDVNRGENRTVLDLEWRSIVGAAQIAADDLDWERSSQLTSALGSFLMMRGEWSVREQMNERVLDVLQKSSDPATEARRIWEEAVALNALGVVARVRTRWAEAESRFLASIQAWDRCHNGGDRWKTFINLGILYRSQHRLDEAATTFSNAISDSQGSIDTVAKGCAHVNLGVVLQMQGRYAEAERHFDEGLKRISSRGHRLGEAQTVNNRGILNRARWSLKEAASDFVTSLALRGLNGGESGIAQTKSNLAIVLQMLGRLEESEEVTLAALDVRRAKGNREGTAASLTNLALLREMQGRRDLAESSLNEALEICLVLKNQIGEAKVRNNLGVMGQEHGCLQAVNDFDRSLALCRKYDDIEGIGRALLNLANTARGVGNFAEAEQLESEAFAIYPMMEEQQANFTAEWERDPAMGERFHAIPYFTNRATGDDLADVVARTLARFRWWDSPAALDAE